MRYGIRLILTSLLTAGFTAGIFAQGNGTISGKVSVTGYKNAANAVVYIDLGQEDPPMVDESDTVDQEGFTFVPHVLPVQVGTTVDFLNSDAELHNVFTPDERAEKFNLGSWPQGQVRSYTFKKSGPVVLLCNVHPEMEGWVFVSPSPYYAKTGENGSFTLEGVPPGVYTVKIWHEKLSGDSQNVTVKSGETASVEFSLAR